MMTFYRMLFILQNNNTISAAGEQTKQCKCGLNMWPLVLLVF